MHSSASQKPTLAAELFGGGVGFRLGTLLRRGCGTLLIGVAVLLLLRRAAGALDEPPGAITALVAMGAAAAVGAVYRKLPPSDPWPDRDTSIPAGMQRKLAYGGLAASLLPTAAMVLIAAALSISGIESLPLLVLWGAVVANEVAWVFVRRAETIAVLNAEIKAALSPAPLRREVGGVLPAVPTEDCDGSLEQEASLDDASGVSDVSEEAGLSQSWTRFVDASGCDVFEGYVRAAFETGSRQAAIHLAFCPPFERTPTLATESLDELELKLTHAVVLPYAARIDVRLAEPAEEGLRVLVGIRAVAAKE